MKLLSLIVALTLVGLSSVTQQADGRTVPESDQFYPFIRGRVDNFVNNLITPYKQTNSYKLIRNFWFSDEAKPIRDKFEEYKERAFERFANSFGKQYNQIELPKRMQTFLDRFNQIENWHHQYEEGKVSYDMEINQMADLTEDELSKLNKLETPEDFANMDSANDDSTPSDGKLGYSSFFYDRSTSLPKSKSWVSYFPKVSDQGSCGSCYAFATADTLAASKAIADGQSSPETYSAQQLVDCSRLDNGCNGGWPSDTLDYIKKAGGIARESVYPYKMRANSCQRRSLTSLRGPDYKELAGESSFMQHLANTGPIIAAMHASSNFQFYKKGLFDDSSCRNRMWNHAVVVAGYGTENGKDFWIIRNSYGSTWGESGYMRMIRGKTQCMLGRMGWGITRV